MFALAAYAGIVEDRPPILRAVLMAADILVRQTAFIAAWTLINVAAISALIHACGAAIGNRLMPSFLLLFFAPWPQSARSPSHGWRARANHIGLALDHLRGRSRDVSHPPRAHPISNRNARGLRHGLSDTLAAYAFSAFRTWLAGPSFRDRTPFLGNYFISAVLQLGMIPPLAYYFHRVTLAGPFANVPALLLTWIWPFRWDFSCSRSRLFLIPLPPECLLKF